MTRAAVRRLERKATRMGLSLLPKFGVSRKRRLQYIAKRFRLPCSGQKTVISPD